MALSFFWRNRGVRIGLALVLLAALGFFGAFPRVVAWRLNQLSAVTLPPLNAQSQALHSRLLVADLHADSLLWSRDLLERGNWGQVDLPRLTDGNVALQVFAAVTSLSWPGSGEKSGSGDMMTALAVAQLWPVRTWTSRLQRALYQAQKLKADVRRAGSGLITVLGKADLDRLLLARSQAQANGVKPPVGVMLAVDGSDVLDDDPGWLQLLFDAGFRMAAPPAGAVGAGLTPAGRQWLGEMEGRGMVVDLARSSPAAVRAIVAEAQVPVVASHAGLRGVCDRPSNLDDEQARGIAATGGVIGIAVGRDAVCGESVEAVVNAIRYAVALVGIEHVALGTNFDGGTRTPIDAAGLARLTHGLTAAGLSDDDIAKVVGGNAWQLLRRVLPD